jgi:predicted ATPase/signal transduction histidine kinase
MTSRKVNIPGYKISEELYNGSRTLVYRGYRETDCLPVVIKLLKNPYPSFSELVQFRNQYTVAKNLNSPNIIQTYSLETYQNGYMLVMEDFGGISLKDYFTNDQTLHVTSLQEFLLCAIALCDTLDILYHQRIIHKDIKPSNILINPESKQVKLIDFSIASLLPRETQTLISLNALEGTLAYISPEQTGRMNRGIDYRTDFYSLGVTFYELLTGELPFKSNDPMELVHCHLAKLPPNLRERGKVEKIPQVFNDIVMKLMAKNAEYRYQSALGIKYDLENCLHQLQETGEIKSFPIAQRDMCDRFIIPDKLYGRETEVKTLLQAFERVSVGATEMMLVAGFSGIGKTVVVNEVHKPIVRQHGYFIKGKYDQFQRNIPFSAFVQAFRDLIGQLLTLNDAQIQKWKSNILEAVGENGQVIIEVIPELSKIIGIQPPSPELSGTAAQNRFNLLFQKFTQVFTSAEHPLVMFLDDLQWADSASLKLMQLLMANTGDLFLIGAYRDNEVNPAHPLMLTLNDIEKTAATINTITLAPLSQGQVNQLVADTLKCSENLALPFSRLVFQKTQGNPFFATQFLKALYQEHLIQFDFESGCWECDIAQVMTQAVTNDVVEFMALQLQKLPESTQGILQLAACIGSQFDLATLAIVCQLSPVEAAASLWKALQSDLILPQSEVYKFYQDSDEQTQPIGDRPIAKYKFLHDRVQQAAYSLIPQEQKQTTHYHIGQLLLQQISPEAREDRIFELVNHLNQAIDLVTDFSAREQLAQLNLKAGQKATAATAYQTALSYLRFSIDLLPANRWQQHYDLTLTLHTELASNACLAGDFVQTEHWLTLALNQIEVLLDQVPFYEIKIQTYVAQSQLQEAIQCGLETLQQLGIELPTQPTPEDFGKGLAEINASLADQSVAELINLPIMTQAKLVAAIRVLLRLAGVIVLGAPHLMPFIFFKMVSLSIQAGNTPFSAPGYATYGMILCSAVGTIDTGYEFGQLALQILDKFPSLPVKAKTLSRFHGGIRHWKDKWQHILSDLQTGYQIGLETGDLETTAIFAQIHGYTSYFSGMELSDLARSMAAYSQAIAQLKQPVFLRWNQTYYQHVLNLLGHTEHPCRLMGDAYDETIDLPQQYAIKDAHGIAIAHLFKAISCYLFQDYEKAKIHLEQVPKFHRAIASFVPGNIYYFYDALVRLALYPSLSTQMQSQFLEQVVADQQKICHFAAHAAVNWSHKVHLLDAQFQQVLGNRLDAIDLYDRGISEAKANGYIQEEALANELAAKFYLNWGKEKIAQVYMQEAYYCYARWGAKAKIEDLEKRYPQLLQPILEEQRINFKHDETIAFRGTYSSTCTNSTGSTNISDILDFTSVLKAAQAISSSLELDQLIASLTRIILENSGAKKSALILPQEDTWQVRAITFIEYKEIQTILNSESIDNCQDIPVTIINYVKNTQQTVVIDNCKTNIPGVIGEYMLEHQPQSVCCTPIINQGHLVGILYLENKLTQGVFTKERLQVINLLSSQAAISLENARFYQQAQQALQDLQQAQLQIVQSEKMSALGNLVAGVAHEMNNPLGFIYASLEQTKPTITDIIEHLKLYQSSLPNPGDEIIDHAVEIDLDYSLEDLPKIIDSMVMACDRLCNISTSLRTFSRADKDYKVPFNIHEGIDSTILILKHRLKANEQRPAIEVITEYGNLPPVDCFPGQLNQVFMNFMANGIDALEESNTGRSFAEIQALPNCITITTSVENEAVKIAIADNGKGMNEEVKQKIFDHLFTTKGVGKGTGLGLAIAKSIIVEKHGGAIAVDSTLAQGTKFTIQLPIHQLTSCT